MSWIQPKFTDFAAPPSKKAKIDRSIQDVLPKSSFSGVARTPRVRSELVVNKKKIEEVEFWLKHNLLKRGNSTILLLAGPPGCGKLTTLKVLCSGMKINLVEWLPQVAQRKFDLETGEFAQSESSLFDEFVTRATRYPNVLNQLSSRLVVVKDVPNCFLRDPSKFHEFLSRYRRVQDVHLAFVITDVSMARYLFPEPVKADFNVTTVNFNPIVQKGVKDALKKTFGLKYLDYVEVVASSCDGDLRKAITTFHFLAKNGTNPPQSYERQNDFLDIFRGLGRILYSKRDEKGQLVHDPVAVGESFVTSPELFLGMLHENYLYTFSSVHDIAGASNYLSSSDLCSTNFKYQMNSTLQALVVASFGVASLNSAPVRQFRQLNKATKPASVLTEFRSRFSDANVLLETVTYGRAIPCFVQENADLIARLPKLK